jgi:DNA polymerase lambda
LFATKTDGKNSAEKCDGPPSKDYKKEILDALTKLMNIYASSGESFKVMGYRRAITNIKAYKGPITKVSQLDGMDGIGKAIREKSRELIEEGRVHKLEFLQNDPKTLALEEFGKIWGVGEKTAANIYAAGVNSIEELRARKSEFLVSYQLVGLKYYEDFQLRMPRDEATKISETVIAAAKKVFGESEIRCETCGSYRRGKASCGDVDVLITRNDDKPIDGMLEPLIVALEKQDFLKERLGFSKNTVRGGEMYMGVCQVPEEKYARRIDIKVYPRD